MSRSATHLSPTPCSFLEAAAAKLYWRPAASLFIETRLKLGSNSALCQCPPSPLWVALASCGWCLRRPVCARALSLPASALLKRRPSYFPSITPQRPARVHRCDEQQAPTPVRGCTQTGHVNATLIHPVKVFNRVL